MAKDGSIEQKKVTTPVFRVSFPQIDKPKAFGGGEPKYSVTMLLDKKVDGSKIKDALKKAAQDQWGSNAEKVIKGLMGTKGWPIHDGDREKPDMMGYEGCYYVKASSKSQPGLIDKDKQEILDMRDLYAGCYARATILAYAYDNEFGKGLGFSLLNLQKISEGAKFTGKKDAADDFDEFEDGSEDSSSYEEETEVEDAWA